MEQAARTREGLRSAVEGDSRVLDAVFLVLFAAAYGLPRVDLGMPLDFDAAGRIYIVDGPWDHLVANVVNVEFAPPGWHFLMKLAMTVSPLGTIETARILGLLAYLSLPVTAYLVGREVDDRFTGVLAGVVVGVMPPLLSFAVRPDHYIWFAALVPLQLLLGARIHTGRDGPLEWVAFSLVTLVLGFVHYFGLAVVGGTGLAGCLSRWRDARREGRIPAAGGLGQAWALLGEFRPWLLAHAPLGLGYLAWSPHLLHQIELLTGTRMYLELNPLTILGMIVPHQGFVPFWLAAGTLVPLGLLGATRFLGSEEGRFGLEAFGAAVAAVALFGILRGTNAQGWMFVVGPSSVAIAAGLRVATQAAGDRGQGTTVRWGATVLLVLGLAVLVVRVAAAPPVRALGDGDGKSTSVFVQEEAAAADDPVILTLAYASEWFLHVYEATAGAPVYGVPVDAIGPDGRAGNIHGDVRYSPGEEPGERERVASLVEGHDTVILFFSHAEGLKGPLVEDVAEMGYQERTRSGNSGTYAVVLGR